MDLQTLADWEIAARDHFWQRDEHALWDFIAGGAGDETTLRDNIGAFAAFRIRQHVLTGAAAHLTTTIRLLGATWNAPLGIAPMALHDLAAPVEGEIATVRAAHQAGVPTVVSAFASRRIEDITAAVPGAIVWQQVFPFKDRDLTLALAERAEQAGAAAVVLTADTPYLGERRRDLRNQLRLPARLIARNLAASLPQPPDISAPAVHSLQAMDPAAGWDTVTRLATHTRLPILVKGITTAEDCQHAAHAGAAGVIVSNHGGRQLDRAVPSLHALPTVAAAAPEAFPVLLDGGVRSGADILIALAAGADAVLVGRPILHSLAVAGSHGVHAVLSLLRRQLAHDMGLAGLPCIEAIGPSAITLRGLPTGLLSGHAVRPEPT